MIACYNQKRADRALIILSAYGLNVGDDNAQASEHIQGLLADLMHYCDDVGIDFADKLQSAIGHHKAEQPDHAECTDCHAIAGADDMGTTCRACGRGILEGVSL